MPQLRDYPQEPSTESTDAFWIDRIGVGTAWVEAGNLSLPLGTNYPVATVINETDVFYINQTSVTKIVEAQNVSVNRCLTYVINGGGFTISTGVAGDLYLPFAVNLQSVTLLADQSGSVTLGIWSAPYSAYPPTSGNSIVASDPPTISSAVKSQDTSLTGWTTAIPAGNVLRFNVASVTSITRLTIALQAFG